MKGYPKHTNTVADFKNLLNMKELKERALKDLKEIHDMKDDKATKVVLKPIFTTKKEYKEHFKGGIITEEAHNIFKNHNQQVSPNTIIVNIIKDASGKKVWFLEDENQRYIIKETSKNLQVGKEQSEEIDNPMPIYKRTGFKSRKEVKELIDQNQEIEKKVIKV